ncbi:zinc finger protein [Macleaya cordata]|uniref:Zinc finger protein n=1 Tax=Macleaya cordata TaxID=56857 RepID=A0A200Q0M4_MACCD|nr:zinc finger protein [Macleaya cordata]OVA06667.1 zinc finger protein [Macleaya cordata]
MGGGCESSSGSKVYNQCESTEVPCQICQLTDHLAPTCPYSYTKCKNLKCQGIRKLMISRTSKNPNRMFLKCQYATCNGSFQWLDDVILENQTVTGNSSTPTQHRSVGCFGCGESDHWKKHCPWLGTTCRVLGCSGIREMKLSSWEGHKGEKYLWCSKCQDFQWFTEAQKLKEASKPSTPVGARIVIETTLEDFCSKLGTFSLK